MSVDDLSARLPLAGIGTENADQVCAGNPPLVTWLPRSVSVVRLRLCGVGQWLNVWLDLSELTDFAFNTAIQSVQKIHLGTVDRLADAPGTLSQMF